MDYNSKYTGEQVEKLLDQVASGGAGSGVTEEYVNTAIANAITATLNTEV